MFLTILLPRLPTLRWHLTCLLLRVVHLLFPKTIVELQRGQYVPWLLRHQPQLVHAISCLVPSVQRYVTTDQDLERRPPIWTHLLCSHSSIKCTLLLPCEQTR